IANSATSGAATTRQNRATVASTQRGSPVRIACSGVLSFSEMTSACMTSTDSSDRLNDMIDFVFTHARKDWQADEALPLRCGHRKILRPAAKRLLIIGMQMQRAPMN